MDNTPNYSAEHDPTSSNWIPTADEQRQQPSLQICYGCGSWFNAKYETCDCWNNPDQPRRKITIGEFHAMLDKLRMLRDDDDQIDDDQIDDQIDDEANPLAWAEEAGLVNPVTCPYCGEVDYVTNEELELYNAHELDLPCSSCGRVHSI